MAESEFAPVPTLVDKLLTEIINPALIQFAKTKYESENAGSTFEAFILTEETNFETKNAEKRNRTVSRQIIEERTNLQDPQNILRILTNNWRKLSKGLRNDGHVELGWINEIRFLGRNPRAHYNELTAERLRRIADTAGYLLDALGAKGNATLARQMRDEATRRIRHMNVRKRLPEVSGTTDTTSMSIAAHLRRLGVKSHPAFIRANLRDHRVIIEDVISVTPLAGEKGVSSDEILISFDEIDPHLPDYFFRTQRTTPIPVDNRARVYIAECRPALMDDDRRVHLKFGPADWHYVLSLKACTEQLHRDLRVGKLSVDKFPGFLGCSVIFETMDNKIMLLRRSEYVEHGPLEWSIGIGANFDRDEDDKPPFGLHPINTIIRELKEEIGLNENMTIGADIRFLHLSQSVTDWTSALLCYVKLPIDSIYLNQCVLTKAEDSGEHRYGEVEMLDFTLDNSVDLILESTFVASDGEVSKVATWSRLSLLYSTIRKFGTDLLIEKLASLP
jgi:Swt1-like HEPN